jgi:trk system potassium uptake protein TrkH
VERLTRDVVVFTFTIEAAGAVLLYLLWGPRLGWSEAVWPAIFHAVSAFCNAGFSTFSTSLVGFQGTPGTLLAISTLVVAGGIGFLTIEELALGWRAWRRRQAFRLSVHSRLVLATTAVLLVAGWVLFGFFEWRATLDALGAGDKLVNAFLLSVMPRSGGFHSVDYTQASDSANFLSIILMFIGGSPGSTAGGLKTTTVALIALLAWDRYRGRAIANLWGRSIPTETIERAVGLAVIGFALVTASIFVYTWTERTSGFDARAMDRRFLSHMFEAVSAFNTVGLSMGITGALSGLGKWLTVGLMFLGRVGPLTLAAALALSSRGERDHFRYAYEDVVVG